MFVFVIVVSSTLSVSAASVETIEEKSQRVTEGILTGSFPTVSDVVEVTRFQLNSSLDDGITATIDNNGNIQILQILDSSVNSRSNSNTKYTAISTIMTSDNSGAHAIDIWRDSETLGNSSIYAVHTTYLNVYYDGILGHNFEITCTKISTIFQYGSSASVSMFYHTYLGRQNLTDVHQLQSNIISPVVSNAQYYYYPAAHTYLNTTFGLIETSAVISVSGTIYTLKNTISLVNTDWLKLFS